jgi:putative thioredoxin
MGGMATFNPARAFDLSAIAEAAKNPPLPPGAASYVLELDQQNFDPTLRLSLKHPVVLEFYSGKDKSSQAFSAVLAEVADSAGGSYLLARADIDTLPELAQAFGIQAVPTVLGVVGGQLAPLFQGTRDRAEVQAVMAQLLQAAQSAGLNGRAQPVTVADVPDPRFAPADAALERGDYAAAVAEFDKILAVTPGDPEAKAGRAQAAFLERVATIDPQQALADAQKSPNDLPAQFAAADVLLADQRAAEAFALLLDLVRRTSGDERESVRLRLLELFETLGANHPDVAKARRELTSALF